jgi:hypothetical protein
MRRIVEGRKSRKLGGPNRVLLLLHFYNVFCAKTWSFSSRPWTFKTIHAVELMCFNLPRATCLGNQVEFRNQFLRLKSWASNQALRLLSKDSDRIQVVKTAWNIPIRFHQCWLRPKTLIPWERSNTSNGIPGENYSTNTHKSLGTLSSTHRNSQSFRENKTLQPSKNRMGEGANTKEYFATQLASIWFPDLASAKEMMHMAATIFRFSEKPRSVQRCFCWLHYWDFLEDHIFWFLLNGRRMPVDFQYAFLKTWHISANVYTWHSTYTTISRTVGQWLRFSQQATCPL